MNEFVVVFPPSGLGPVGDSIPIHATRGIPICTGKSNATRFRAKCGKSGPFPAQNKPKLVAIKEAARQLGLGRTKVNQMIDEGVRRVQRIGRRKLVTESSIEALLGR